MVNDDDVQLCICENINQRKQKQRITKRTTNSKGEKRKEREDIIPVLLSIVLYHMLTEEFMACRERQGTRGRSTGTYSDEECSTIFFSLPTN